MPSERQSYNKRGRANDDWTPGAATAPDTATQPTIAALDEAVNAVEPAYDWAELDTSDAEIGWSGLFDGPIYVSATDSEDLQASETSVVSEEEQLLEDCKTYVLSKLKITDKNRSKLRELLHDHNWPSVWQSLDTIKNCGGGLSWEWGTMDTYLLFRLKDTKLLSWQEIAEYFFIGMRATQCKSIYENVIAEEEEEARRKFVGC
ncbi:hypothetical protein BKA58DRAFT_454787 [Alternaria rosae]|uniref:uncharacterized protein n=1 Tax=Alternaria rosae TaxID=1187941 RepID=UPI001E8CD3EB|nr:uncharacterized protein BKA58DRAFT_454787 [Alternaria rosae]KAH6875751.1 hypothetical protein BKA58DRAFT_454787 [Alternaria rosae]